MARKGKKTLEEQAVLNWNLLRAARCGEKAKLLRALDMGADVEMRDEMGMTSAMKAAMNSKAECLKRSSSADVAWMRSMHSGRRP